VAQLFSLGHFVFYDKQDTAAERQPMDLADCWLHYLWSFDERPRGVPIGLDTRWRCWMRWYCFGSFTFVFSEG
jgi:hypothetical protein